MGKGLLRSDERHDFEVEHGVSVLYEGEGDPQAGHEPVVEDARRSGVCEVERALESGDDFEVLGGRKDGHGGLCRAPLRGEITRARERHQAGLSRTSESGTAYIGGVLGLEVCALRGR